MPKQYTIVMLYISIIIMAFVLYIQYILLAKAKESFINQTMCVVFVLDKQVGFFSDLGFLAESYIRAKRAGIPFLVDSSQWSYKHSQGWRDYFQSLSEVPGNIDKLYNKVVYCKHPTNGHDYPDIIKSIDNSLSITLHDYELAVKDLFILNDDIKNKAEQLITSYGNKGYEAIYIRRGDKIQSESPNKSTKDIIAQCSFTDSLPLYVQSDNYEEVNLIRNIMSKKQLFYTTPETKKGAHESERQSMSAQEKRDEMFNFLTGVYICCNAKKCWVDILSNVSRFIKLYSPTTVEFYKIGNEIPNYYANKQLSYSVAYESSFT